MKQKHHIWYWCTNLCNVWNTFMCLLLYSNPGFFLWSNYSPSKHLIQLLSNQHIKQSCCYTDWNHLTLLILSSAL